MARRCICLFVLTAAVVLIWAGAPLQTISAAAAEKTVREKAPDFTLKDLNGASFRLSASRSKPVLLIFGTTWCTYCRSEIPHFKNIHARYGQRGLEVVNVDIQEPQDRVARFARRHDLPYRILLDTDGRVAELYSVVGVPMFVLVDGEGYIACWQCRRVEEIMDRLLRR
jgi:peroxiredoxin